MNVRRFHGDAGASMVLALAFLALLGVFVASVLSLGAVSFENTVVTRKYEDRLYAADGGIEWGVQKLTDKNVCPRDNLQDGLGSFTAQINGETVTVECVGTETTSGQQQSASTLSPVMGGYAIITRSTTHPAIQIDQANNAPRLQIKGNVYARGGIQSQQNLPIDLTGSLRVGTSQKCPPQLMYVTASGGCTKSNTIPVTIPNPPQVVVPQTAAPAAQSNGANCTILYPGRYDNAPNINSPNAYLASGTYYIRQGNFEFNGTVFGGAPGSDIKQMTGQSPCADDAIADQKLNDKSKFDASKAGSGITIILGNTAVLRLQSSNAKVEFYNRVPLTTSPDAASTPNVSVWGRGLGQKGGASPPSAYQSITNPQPFNTQDRTSTMVIHGATYLPESSLYIREPMNLDAPGTGLFMGGVVANHIQLAPRGNGQSSDLAYVAGGGTTSGPPTPTKTTLKATATGPNGTNVITAIIDRTTSPPTITSWRQE